MEPEQVFNIFPAPYPLLRGKAQLARSGNNELFCLLAVNLLAVLVIFATYLQWGHTYNIGLLPSCWKELAGQGQ